ncbi:MAG: MBL fold metallo-hydrolase [Desulfurella sp.]|uniref:MBL fold metallo-hydrolase n=1 Tax=Desulfurella sp. TaxID=1962857 RepID=UPI000CAD2722|nr:MBL fold metallo-hydrolase [Desulfurella sp.]PMP88804.1 MAG: MBL fold metallo-hydrolase [Desulfurella sp.]
MELKMVILNDNEPSPGLKNEWGWSLFIEFKGKKILFDADTSAEIIKYNSKKLNIDLDSVDFAFLSHYHMDHYGGYGYFAGKKSFKVYTPDDDKILREFGLLPIEVKGFKEIEDGVFSTGAITGFGLKEHAMVIRLDYLNILIVGCSHPGIDNIAKIVYENLGEIYFTIGGFHEPSLKALDKLAEISKYVAPAHCSGNKAKEYVKKNYNSKYIETKTGSKIILPF